MEHYIEEDAERRTKDAIKMKEWKRCLKHNYSYSKFCIYCLQEENPDEDLTMPYDGIILKEFLSKYPEGSKQSDKKRRW